MDLRILVADEDESHAREVASFLEGIRTRCVITADGPEALRLAEGGGFGVIITELSVGDVGWREILERARRGNPAAGVVVLTGRATIRSAVDAVAAGADGYLTKPADAGEIVGAIARIRGAGRGPMS